MLLQLHTGRVAGYSEGQQPLIYLVSSAQQIVSSGAGFVYSDAHGIAAFTKWFDSLRDLDKIDWAAVYAEYWNDTVDHMDRQRRKQAEFLVHRTCSRDLINEIAVIDQQMVNNVERILERFPQVRQRPVKARPQWYY